MVEQARKLLEKRLRSCKEKQMLAGWGVGHTLRERREQLGMSLGGLGARAGVHPTGISRVELGERRATAELLIKLAPALALSRFELLSLAGYLEKGEG